MTSQIVAIPTVVMTADPPLVRANETTRLRCILTGFRHNSIVNIEKWLYANPQKPIKELVSQATTCTELYRNTGRFSVTSNVNGEILEYTLMIQSKKNKHFPYFMRVVLFFKLIKRFIIKYQRHQLNLNYTT